MADAAVAITVFTRRGVTPASLEDDLIRDAGSRSEAIQALSALVASAESQGGMVSARVDSYTGAAASGSFTCVQANCTAGDKLIFSIPGYSAAYVLTGKAGAATEARGQNSI